MKSRSEIFMTAGFSYLFNGPFFSDKSQIVCVIFFFCNSPKREKKKEGGKGENPIRVVGKVCATRKCQRKTTSLCAAARS